MNETLMIMVRSTIGFLTLLLFTRILGKQQISQLTYFDYVLGITIGSITGTLSTELSGRAFPYWAGLATWVILVLIFQFLSMKWRYFSKYVDGEPTVVIMHGEIMEKTLRKMRYRVTDLLQQLRVKGVFDVNEVEHAVMETNGKLSLLKKAQYLPLTPKDINIQVSYKGLSTELIYDGVIYDQNLIQVSKDRVWLENELTKQGIQSASEVFLCLLDQNGQLFIDKYKDHKQHIIDISDYKGPN